MTNTVFLFFDNWVWEVKGILLHCTHTEWSTGLLILKTPVVFLLWVPSVHSIIYNVITCYRLVNAITNPSWL